jgi:hypothetical protein
MSSHCCPLKLFIIDFLLLFKTWSSKSGYSGHYKAQDVLDWGPFAAWEVLYLGLFEALDILRLRRF